MRNRHILLLKKVGRDYLADLNKNYTLMKNFILLSILFASLFSCNTEVETEEVFDSNSFTKISLDAATFKVEEVLNKANTSSLYYIYKKAIWIKKGYAVMFSPKEKKMLVYNPKKYAVLQLENRLTLWTGEFSEYSGCNCDAGELCVNGVCKPSIFDDGLPEEPCGGACPEGSICMQGNCQIIETPCGGNCPEDHLCINGVCEPSSTESCKDCAPGDLCVNGQCIPDPCRDCEPGEICIDGNCSNLGDEEEIDQLIFY